VAFWTNPALQYTARLAMLPTASFAGHNWPCTHASPFDLMSSRFIALVSRATGGERVQNGCSWS